MSANDLRASQHAVDFIAKEEGCVLTPYRDFAGKWTVGVGHLLGGSGPHARITKAEAQDLLRFDVRRFEDTINRIVAVPLEQHEFDALVSFTFNVGAGAFASSTLLKMLNAGRRDEAAEQFLVWCKYTDPATGKKLTSATLLGRRRRERLMFLGEGGVDEPPPSAA